ncbi:expressed unknown protein [Seminavis robusta]|uniref:Uncharacterized protein n=1 Tax=Seminavis robusta TaxID=568900 RepID=A0A9N8DBI1_9STRA|nr:expressed unknown protein [Seminavis robusta]|eukprot:Sro24_g016300.1 n/a (121) ;mRNA; f:31400-31762
MGNTKSITRADIEHAAANTNWDEKSEILAVLKTKKAKKSKRSSKRNERLLQQGDIDEIYDLVLSLKQDGGEGQDLLEEFVAQQANLSRKDLSDEKPPIRTISVAMDRSDRGSGKARARAA